MKHQLLAAGSVLSSATALTNSLIAHGPTVISIVGGLVAIWAAVRSARASRAAEELTREQMKRLKEKK